MYCLDHEMETKNIENLPTEFIERDSKTKQAG